MLSLLFECDRANQQAGGLDIVVVPAIGLNQPSQWISSSGSPWLQKLAEDVGSGVIIWQYAHGLNRQISLAQQLLDEGRSFLQALHNHCTQTQPRKLPIVFVCHGTGGFVLKKALSICRNQLYEYRSVADVISGFIFLGSPHFSGDVDDVEKARRTFDLLLKCQNKGIGRSLSSKAHIEDLVRVCKAFELLNFGTPVVSVYETKETVTAHSFFSKIGSKSRGQMIVPKEVVTLGAAGEVVVDGEADHCGICNVNVGSKVYRASENLLIDVMKYAPRRIAETSQPGAVPLALRDATLQSASSVGGTMFEDQLTELVSLSTSSPRGGATGGTSVGSFEILPAMAALEVDSRDPILPCFMLGTRRKLEQFIGREDMLKTIDEHLLPSEAPSSGAETTGQLRSFAICGLGGMGKTELAIEYAYRRRKDFEAIFWLNADDATILAANFAQIAIQLGLEADDSADFAASRDIVMAWLADPLKKSSGPDTPENMANWLIIFDNVDNLDVLSDYWPKLGRGSVLVTSRDPRAKQNIFIDSGLHLPRLSQEESEALMQKLTRIPADSAQKKSLSAISKTLDGLPLIISHMAGVFRELRLSYTDFLRLYNDEGVESLYGMQIGADNEPVRRSLMTLWALDKRSSKTKALLQVISLLDPDEIPEDLLIGKRGVVTHENYPQSTGDYYQARAELLASSLINQNTEQKKIGLHRILQDTVRGRMTEGELAIAFQTALNLVVAAWPFQSMKEHHSIARFSKCEDIFPSVLRLKDRIEHLIQSSTSFPLDIRVARLFNDVGWYMFERGLPEETRPFCDLGILIGQRLKKKLGAEAIESIRESHSFLGIALVETNEHSLSMSHKKKWLDMLLERRSDSGEAVEDYELGYAYNEIGVAYGNEDQLEKAVAAFCRSIEVFQGLDDYDDTMLGWPEPNLGFMYWLQGDLDNAEHALVEILDIHAATWGVDDTKSFKTGKILYGMGNVLESQGRFEESLGFHRRCLEQFKKVLGPNHHRFGDICHRMAGHSIRQGHYKEAESYLDMALRIFKSRPYLTNELARTTFRKSRLYRMSGLSAKAEQLLNEAYKLRRRLEPWDGRSLHQVEEKDYDKLVAFWSR